MIIFAALLTFWSLVLAMHIKSYYKHTNESTKSIANNKELEEELNKTDNEYNDILDKYIATSDELDKIKKIYYDLDDLNSQSLNANRHILKRLSQIDTIKYLNKDEVKNKLDASFNKLNEVFAK